MSDLTPLTLPATREPVRVAVRRLRWLRTAFAEQLAVIAARSGVSYRIDDRKLAAAFVAWLRRVEAQNPRDPERRRAYFTFAAGLMLQELVRTAQEFDARTDVVPSFFDIRTSWSFRENAAEHRSSVGFFDLFVGEEPDWDMPTVFRDKLRGQLATSPMTSDLARLSQTQHVRSYSLILGRHHR